MTILILSCGTRNKLLRFFKESLGKRPGGGRVVATDCSPWAPALYEADAFYLVSRMDAPGYLDELDLLAKNQERFRAEGIVPVVSALETVELCRDKYRFYRHLLQNGLPALVSCKGLAEFDRVYAEGKIRFPVFVKPVRGCGSVGACRVEDRAFLEALCRHEKEELLIQQLAQGEEFGIDVYVDLLSHKPVRIFAKKKVRMRAGETEKAVSVREEALFALAERTAAAFSLAGPIDMDVFCVDGEYYVSEINPRFGGGYPHAYHCRVDFPALIANNLSGKENEAAIGAYEAGICMMKYSDEIIRRL